MGRENDQSCLSTYIPPKSNIQGAQWLAQGSLDSHRMLKIRRSKGLYASPLPLSSKREAQPRTTQRHCKTAKS